MCTKVGNFEITGVISEIKSGFYGVHVDGLNNVTNYEFLESDLILEGNVIEKFMEKFLNLFDKEPQLSYKKVGIYDAKNLPTTDGIAMFLKYVLDGDSEIAVAFRKDIVEKLVAQKDDDK